MFLHQHVDFPTRFREGCTPSQLDLVFSNEELMVEELTSSSPLGKSDHVVLTFQYRYQSVCPQLTKLNNPAKGCIYNYKKGNYTEMALAFSTTDWSEMDHLTAEQAWKFLLNEIKTKVEKHVPVVKKRKRRNPKAPWWSVDLRKEVRRKHRAWMRYVNNKTPDNFAKYKTQRNLVTNKTRQARLNYERNIVSCIKHEPKKLHSYIRSQQRVRATVGPLETEDGSLTESDTETAEVLQKFFLGVFVNEEDKVPELPLQVRPTQQLSNFEIHPQEVHKELLNLDTSKAAGPDGLKPIVLKTCAAELAKPLTVVFQKTLNTGKLPTDWKLGKITPIFKKGGRKKATNYRPVSLTSQACKVMERIVRRHIIEHLHLNNLESKHQHGFMQKKSCQSNLLETFEECTRAIDEGYNLDIIYLDYKKAFDTVPNKRLLSKLKSYGISGEVWCWLEDFLYERKQKVCVGNGESSWGEVKSGIPQGSVLGPVLFLIYVNELPSLVSSKIKLFADDTKIYRAIRDNQDVEALQTDLDTLARWTDSWLLKFNTGKCKVMHCGRNNPASTYTLTQDGQTTQLLKTTQERDLGVMVEDTLKPTLHCHHASVKGMAALRRLKNAFMSINKENFKPLFNTYVRPHLEFCIQAVGPYMAQDFKELEQVQRRATKLVPGLKSLSYDERLKQLQLYSVKTRVLRGDLIETYKIITGKAKLETSQFFKLNQDTRTRGHN